MQISNTIYLIGLTEYLIEVLDIPKYLAFEISSRVNLSNLNENSIQEFERYLTEADFLKLVSKIKNYPLKTSTIILGIGISFNFLESILRHFGKSESLADLLLENPYLLLDIEGLSFQKIDKIATEIFKIPENSPLRYKSFVVHHLTTICFKSNHLFMPLRDFFQTKIEIPVEEVKTYLKELIESKKIIFENGNLYPLLYYKAEVESAKKLADLIKLKNTSTFFEGINVEDYIKEYEDSQTQNIANGKWKKLKWANNKFELSKEQKIAIRKFFTERFFIITGLPGTGKTAVVKALVDISKSKNLKINLMTPTGVASKRLSDLCDFPAATIHKTLNCDGYFWNKNKDNPLDSDIYIVDESSMLDQVLLYRLLDALPEKNFILVFIGDPQQIPSVGPGNILYDLISNPKISHIKLTKIFRQESISEIVLNSHKISNGETNLFGKKDFFFIQIEDQHEILEAIIKIVNKYKNHNIQVLSPTYKNLLGVTNLNSILRDILNPDEEKNTEFFKFRINDKIMILRNDYRFEIYNGEQGIIKKIKSKNKKYIIQMLDGKEIEYSFKDIYSLISLDYARTIHKSQGQEYDIVILPYIRQFSIQLQRNLLYTACTRSKEKLFLIGHRDALVKSIKNMYIQKRNTNFSNKLNLILNN